VSDRGDAAQQIKKRTWEAVRPSRVRQLFREVDPVSRFRKQHEEGNRIHHAASQPEEFSNAIPLRRSRDHRHAGRRANRGLVRAAAWPTPMAATMAVRCRTAERGRSPGIAVGIAGLPGFVCRDPLQSNEKDGHCERALRKGLIW
jgi:hypothetical protein